MAYSPARTKDQLLNRNLDQISATVKAFPTQWILVGQNGGPVFQNGWVNTDTNGAGGNTGRNARFTFDPSGWVILDGQIKSGTVNTTAFILPIGMRPGHQMHFAVNSNSAFGSIAVNNDGTVVPAVGNNAWFWLSGIRFLPEN